MTPHAAFRTLNGCLSARTRKHLLVGTLLALVARVAGALAATALVVSLGRGVLIALAAGFVVSLERAVRTRLRILAEGDLYRACVRGLLAADVLAVGGAELPLAVHEGVLGAQSLLLVVGAGVVDAMLVAVSLPLFCIFLPWPIVAGAALALLSGALLLRHVGRWVRALEVTAQAAYTSAADRFASTVGARLELVASATEAEAQVRLDEQLRRWERAALRSAWLGGVLARSSMFVAAAIGAGVVLVRENPLAGMDAPRLAALGALFLPAAAGLGLAWSTARRGSVQATPFLELVARPARDEPGHRVPEFTNVIRARDLGFGYGEGTVLGEVDFETPERGLVVIAGPNGSGKSTLLRLVLGLRAPWVGSLSFGAIGIAEIDTRATRAATAFLPQRPHLGEAHETVRAAFELIPHGGVDEHAIRAALVEVGLPNALDRMLGELSAGQRQRVALARLIIRKNVRWVLLDEPEANLDAGGIAIVRALIRGWTAEGKLVVVAAHSNELLGDAAQVIRLA